MKLQAGNPNLMKKFALRVNATMPLESFTNTLGNVAAKRLHRAVVAYTPRQRDEHEALPPTINVWKQPVYVPEKTEPARRGADDFRRVQSRGFR